VRAAQFAVTHTQKALALDTMSTPRRKRLEKIIDGIVADRASHDPIEVIYDMLDGAIMTRDEAIELTGLEPVPFSRGLRERRAHRKEFRV
jgi:hypothetical protein